MAARRVTSGLYRTQKDRPIIDDPRPAMEASRPPRPRAKIVADPIGIGVRVGGPYLPLDYCVGCVSSRNISLGWLAVSGTRDDVTIQMKSQTQPTTQEVLAGLVERVTFHNDDSGFCVLRIKARGHRELITVIGHAAVR